MTSFLLHADDLLRGGPWAMRPDRPRRVLLHLFAFVVLFGVFYGAVMGSFGGVAGRRALQPVYSGLKVPLLLLVTFGLSLPSFFVLNTILGVRSDFRYVLRGLIATQAALTIVLAALAPVTAFWYASSADYESALMFNALMFLVASVAAQFLLRRWYRPLVEHGTGRRWSSVPAPGLPGYDGRLMAVAGSAGGELWAVGSASRSAGPQRVLILHRCASSPSW